MALATAKMMVAAFREIERSLERLHKTQRQAFQDANISSSAYYRYRDGRFSPTVETVFRLARFADLHFGLTVGAYTVGQEVNAGGNVDAHEASIIAEMADLSEKDKEHLARYVERYAALRRAQPSEPPPARASGSRVAKAE